MSRNLSKKGPKMLDIMSEWPLSTLEKKSFQCNFRNPSLLEIRMSGMGSIIFLNFSF